MASGVIRPHVDSVRVMSLSPMLVSFLLTIVLSCIPMYAIRLFKPKGCDMGSNTKNICCFRRVTQQLAAFERIFFCNNTWSNKIFVVFSK